MPTTNLGLNVCIDDTEQHGTNACSMLGETNLYSRSNTLPYWFWGCEYDIF